MLRQSNGCWGSGMLILGSATLLARCEALSAGGLALAGGVMADAKVDLDFIRPNEEGLEASPNIQCTIRIKDGFGRA